MKAKEWLEKNNIDLKKYHGNIGDYEGNICIDKVFTFTITRFSASCWNITLIVLNPCLDFHNINLHKSIIVSRVILPCMM